MLTNNSLGIFGPYFGPYELQYPFLIPINIDKQLLIRNLPSMNVAYEDFLRGEGWIGGWGIDGLVG